MPRADIVLVNRGLFESRTRAQAAIAAGLVIADGKTIAKASDNVRTDAVLEATDAHPYVSRGGIKLAAALDAFAFDPRKRIGLDVGASTGGFTDVLLKRGAAHVVAVDTGTGQLHESLRLDPRVTNLEKTDIRHFTPATLPMSPEFAVVDVSFISLEHVLPAIEALVSRPGFLVVLVKPQFEAGRSRVKKGIVRDSSVRREVCDRISHTLTDHGWTLVGEIPSPITGGDGNQEFLIGAIRD